MKQPKTYNYTIPANGSVDVLASNSNIYMLASTGAVTIVGDTFGAFENMVAGQGILRVPFNRLTLVDKTGAPNTIKILLAPDEYVSQIFSGSVTVVGPVTMDPASQAFSYGAAFKSASLIGASATEQVFSAAANVNGAILWSASFLTANGAAIPYSAFIAHTVAPAAFITGDMILQGLGDSASNRAWAQLQRPVRIAAGKGLWYFNQVAETGGARSALYTLL